MWGLYGWLLSKGQIVYPNASYENKDFVAIYPEIFHGNETGAKKVVRYILNKPGVMSSMGVPGPTEFNKNDELYYFSRLFAPEGVDDNHILFLPIIDLHLFKDQKKKRDKKCYFVGKGIERGLHPKDCIKIDRSFAQDQQKLADLLNECEVMYSYDSVSAMFEVARLCGCRVVVFPSEYTKEEFSKYEPGMNGISWGLEDYQKLDTEAFRGHYEALRGIFEKRLDKFIEETQK